MSATAPGAGIPDAIETARLRLHAPRAGDGPALNAAIEESFAELSAWMPWARQMPSVAESEAYVREAAARFASRAELPRLIRLRDGGALVGGTGLHRIDWAVPSFEVGYWCRTSMVGRGYVTEAVFAQARHAFEALGARRFEARMDDRNERSWRIAERLGFVLEGLLCNDSRANDGTLRSTRVYAVTGLDQLETPPS